jgi:hypothetical protein
MSRNRIPYARMRIRVGVPLVARGPAANIADSSFTAIQLPNGKFRGFTAAGTTWAIDGNHPYDMGGAADAVLKPGLAGSPDSCGQWIVHVEVEGKTLYGWNHNETACNYAKYGQTHASMTMARSSDYGHTWKIEGLIITGTDPPHDSKNDRRQLLQRHARAGWVLLRLLCAQRRTLVGRRIWVRRARTDL